jgi:AcrR family transcriptional regulator
MSRRPDSKDAILAAAEIVVAEAGAAHLTLDAVAARAGLSKGGLLYHFPSKEALLQGMLSRLLERVDSDRGRFQRELGDSPAADLQAHVLAGFHQHPSQDRVSAAMLAAGANDPRLLEPVRRWQRDHFEQLVKTKAHPTKAAVIMLAVDGLWLNELLRTSPFGAEEREEVLKELLVLAKTTAA